MSHIYALAMFVLTKLRSRHPDAIAIRTAAARAEATSGHGLITESRAEA